MPLTTDEVLHIARLARLEVGPEDLPRYAQELSVILDYVAQLATVDTAASAGAASADQYQNVFREDRVTPSLDRARIFEDAPRHDEEYFIVPKVIG